MTDAKPNAIEMLKLPQDAFMLEVSRVVSLKPWTHPQEPYNDDGVLYVCANECGAEFHPGLGWISPIGEDEPECPVPPRLTESPEWWAFKLTRQCYDTDEAALLLDTLSDWYSPEELRKRLRDWYWDEDDANALFWFACAATAQEQIAVCLVALGHWRIEP